MTKYSGYLPAAGLIIFTLSPAFNDLSSPSWRPELNTNINYKAWYPGRTLLLSSPAYSAVSRLVVLRPELCQDFSSVVSSRRQCRQSTLQISFPTPVTGSPAPAPAPSHHHDLGASLAIPRLCLQSPVQQQILRDDISSLLSVSRIVSQMWYSVNSGSQLVVVLQKCPSEGS